MNTEQKKPVYKKWWFWTGLVILCFLVGRASATPSETQVLETYVESSTETASTPKEYREVFTFSGNGAKKSEPFTVYGKRFKIAYECNGDPQLTLCQAYLHDMAGGFPQVIMNSIEPITDETIMYGQGYFYIESNVIGDFTMTVYDYN
jgi:hypothetical protein